MARSNTCETLKRTKMGDAAATHDLSLDGGLDLLVRRADEDVIAGEVGHGHETLFGIVPHHVVAASDVGIEQRIVAEQVEVIDARRKRGERPLPISPEMSNVYQRRCSIASVRLRHRPGLL